MQKFVVSYWCGSLLDIAWERLGRHVLSSEIMQKYVVSSWCELFGFILGASCLGGCVAKSRKNMCYPIGTGLCVLVDRSCHQKTNIRVIQLMWASLFISWERLGKQVLQLNHVTIHGILGIILGWVSLDASWVCLGKDVLL